MRRSEHQAENSGNHGPAGVMGRAEAGRRLAYLKSRKGEYKSQKVVGDEAKEVTKDSVTKAGGQEKELYTVSKYLPGHAHAWTRERNAMNESFISVFNRGQGKLLFEGKQELLLRWKAFFGNKLLYLEKFQLTCIYLQRLTAFSCLFISIAAVSLIKVKRAQILFKFANLKFFSYFAME